MVAEKRHGTHYNIPSTSTRPNGFNKITCTSLSTSFYKIQENNKHNDNKH